MNVNPEIAINRTYSLTMPQIAKVSQLSANLRENQSEIVRRAIDLLYEKFEAGEVQAKKEPAATAEG